MIENGHFLVRAKIILHVLTKRSRNIFDYNREENSLSLSLLRKIKSTRSLKSLSRHRAFSFYPNEFQMNFLQMWSVNFRDGQRVKDLRRDGWQ